MTDDGFGYTWLVVHRSPDDVGRACAPTSTPSTPAWRSRASPPGCCARWSRSRTVAGRRVGLVYLYKQGTFYAFAPPAGDAQVRDNLLEMSVRDQLAGELPMEADLSRWFALWGAPGL